MYSSSWRRQWQPTPVLLLGKSHGRRSLVGCSPWGRQESDTTERLHFHFSLSCIGEGNGNPLQCWRIPRTGEPGGQPSIGSHRVGHDWSGLAAAAAAAAFQFWWQPANQVPPGFSDFHVSKLRVANWLLLLQILYHHNSVPPWEERGGIRQTHYRISIGKHF